MILLSLLPLFFSLRLRVLLSFVHVYFLDFGILLTKKEIIQFESFHLSKHLTWDKAQLADNGGISKSFEIEYTLIKDLAFCKPAIHLNPLLINFWVLFVLALFKPSKGTK